MYKVSSWTLNLYSSLRDSQIFVRARLSLRDSQTVVTGHSVLRHSQNLQTSKHGQAHTIQIVRAHARNLTMAAILLCAAPGINWLCRQFCNDLSKKTRTELIRKSSADPSNFCTAYLKVVYYRHTTTVILDVGVPPISNPITAFIAVSDMGPILKFERICAGDPVLHFLGCIECMRCRLLLPVIAVFVCHERVGFTVQKRLNRSSSWLE